MTPTRLDHPRRLSCLFFLRAVILSILSPCHFLCVALWNVALCIWLCMFLTTYLFVFITPYLHVRIGGSKSAYVCTSVSLLLISVIGLKQGMIYRAMLSCTHIVQNHLHATALHFEHKDTSVQYVLHSVMISSFLGLVFH